MTSKRVKEMPLSTVKQLVLLLKMLLQRQGLGFAVAEAGDVADELASLVGDAHFDGGEFGMVEHLRGFGT